MFGVLLAPYLSYILYSRSGRKVINQRLRLSSVTTSFVIIQNIIVDEDLNRLEHSSFCALEPEWRAILRMARCSDFGFIWSGFTH